MDDRGPDHTVAVCSAAAGIADSTFLEGSGALARRDPYFRYSKRWIADGWLYVRRC